MVIKDSIIVLQSEQSGLYKNGASFVVIGNALENDEWHHLAFTYDFSSSIGQVFIEGQLEGSNTLGFNFGNGGNYQAANFLYVDQQFQYKLH